MATTEERLSNLEAILPTLATKTDMQQIFVMLGAIIDRLDALEQRMDALEQRMDAMEKRLDARIDGLARRLGGVEKQLGQLIQWTQDQPKGINF